MNEHEVPLTVIAKRLNINYGRLLRIKKHSIDDPQIAFQRYKPRPQYTKLHSRARQRINKLLVEAMNPIQVSDI